MGKQRMIRDVLLLAGFVVAEVGMALSWRPGLWLVAAVVVLGWVVLPEIRWPGWAVRVRPRKVVCDG